MRLTVSKRGNTPSESAGEVFDIDVTPVMNMFVVLIPFLVSMAVFSHFSSHQFYLPSNAGSGLDQSSGRLKLKTTVVVAPKYLLVTLGGDVLDSLPVTDTGYPFSDLLPAIAEGRSRSSDSLKTVVSVADGVKFKEVVTAMDICRTAGFEAVGLSSAPEQEEKDEISKTTLSK